MAEGLRGRVADKRQQANGSGNSEVVKKAPTILDSVQRMGPEFEKAMPSGMEAVQLIRDAVTAIRTTPKLAECEQASVLGGLMTCAQLGLRVGVLGHAWLLPLWSGRNSRFEAQLIIGYQGMIELAHRSDKIDSAVARVVYEKDHFDVEYGLSDRLEHKPAMKGSRGDPVAFYAVIKFRGGGHVFWVMSQDEMIEHRDKYAMAKKKDGTIVGPWRDNYEAMGQKTVLRAVMKFAPKATELGAAITADETVRLDPTPNMDAMMHGANVIDGDYSVVGDGGEGDAGPTDEEIAAMNAEANAEAASAGSPKP